MSRKTRKTLIFTGKLAVAVLLLFWVLGQVHWRDYVQAKAGGRTYAVLEALPNRREPAELRIGRGLFGSEEPRLQQRKSTVRPRMRWIDSAASPS